MTELEKIEAEEYKLNRIISNDYCCEVCNKKYNKSELQLAHIVAASKQNIKDFGRLVMYHNDMMVLTCSSCNSSVLTNKASNPIKAQEKIIDILSKIMIDDPIIFKYKELHNAFKNLGACKSDNIITQCQYGELSILFAKYEKEFIK